MEEDWYAVEQQIRDRLSEARAAARIRTLIQTLAPTARRPNSIRITIIHLANWVLAFARQLPARGGLRRPISQPAGSSALLPDDHQMVAQDVALIEGRDARVTGKE